ncbi:MAG: nucleoside kinase [Eubacterium sp.]|nr:nucleoside kinase [Eubacterium sp.]MCI8917504.1 nucleoside kinase [Eubacterium sp.]
MDDQKCRAVINGEEKEFAYGTSFLDIAKKYQQHYKDDIALVIFNNKLRELNKKLETDGVLEFVTTADTKGRKAYRRSLLMILEKAIFNLYKTDVRLRVMHTLGQGQYCELEGDLEISEDVLDSIRSRMQQLADADIPIRKNTIHTDAAVVLFQEYGMPDKARLFQFRRSSHVNLYDIDGFQDYFYGYMMPSTGYLKYFDLLKYENGFILVYPYEDTKKAAAFETSGKLYHTLMESAAWAQQMHIGTIGELNEQVVKGRIQDVILLQEAEMEQRIGKIAEKIAGHRNKKFILIAGPSSSGKTTFSHRLSIQLRAHGLTPHPIGMDNYYVDREKTPLDENGQYDFECLEAVDLSLFNADMGKLLEGREIELPYFNFKTGKREYKGEYLQLGPEDVLVIEGIHGLNDRLLSTLPAEAKFKIYISALTQINMDEHNAIPTTDGRLIRRIVRDALTRGSSAERTIKMWQSVRRGEEKNIFPFQEHADVMFNSALIYELAVLKMYAEPLLFAIPSESPQHLQAKRLLKFLDYFLQVPSEDVGRNSILREFIGGSCFKV